MGICVYITRKQQPLADGGVPITETEWTAVTQSQADFLRVDDAGGFGGVREFSWKHPSGDSVPFTWSDGEIEVKSPDARTVVRMLDAARALQARVVSETGEVFDSRGTHAGFEKWSEFHVEPKRSFFDKLLGRA
jgi:hypothetical protein